MHGEEIIKKEMYNLANGLVLSVLSLLLPVVLKDFFLVMKTALI